MEGVKKGEIYSLKRKKGLPLSYLWSFLTKTCKLYIRPVKSAAATAWASCIESEETINCIIFSCDILSMNSGDECLKGKT